MPFHSPITEEKSSATARYHSVMACRRCEDLTAELKTREREYASAGGRIVSARKSDDEALYQARKAESGTARTNWLVARLALEKHQQDSHEIGPGEQTNHEAERAKD